MRSRRIILLGAAALLIAACTPVDRGLGEAQRYNMAIQTINPDPVYAEGSAEPGSSGTVARSAAERYRTGNVKGVETISSTESSGSGSGSGPK